MGRVAVFVDAGYFYARCSEVLCGPGTSRRAIELDEQKLVRALTDVAEQQSKGRDALLRIYWYDGAPSSGLTPEQLRLADVDDLKMRLGVVNPYGQQKGVDSLIVMDLIDLARNHAIDSALLVTGDEDIRVSVTVAQAYGVRVHLLGLGVGNAAAQSRALVREVDTTLEWDAASIAAFARPREQRPMFDIPTRPITAEEVPAVGPSPADVSLIDNAGAALKKLVEVPSTSPAVKDALNAPDPPEGSEDAAARINTAVATFLATLTTADRDDILFAVEKQKSLPALHDRRMLGFVGRTFARRLSPSERTIMRQTALALLRASAAEDPSSSPLGQP